MGEGVPNLIGFIIDLIKANNKIFLIEEPENDLHPGALKSLLNLIIEKSKSNQFFVTTHSNIVMKYLGGIETAKIFNLTSQIGEIHDRPKLFMSQMEEVADNPNDRMRILEDLGYDTFDFEIWDSWLFLEESSAQTIIQFLIKYFVPSLEKKLKVFSAGGIKKVHPKFENFNQLFVFLHLEPIYLNKVWVKIDGGIIEENIIKEMKGKYLERGWNEENFGQFKEHDFEAYYPESFQTEVKEILALKDGSKQSSKEKLIIKVKDWILNNENLAINEFKDSAAEVIEFLLEIENNLVLSSHN